MNSRAPEIPNSLPNPCLILEGLLGRERLVALVSWVFLVASTFARAVAATALLRSLAAVAVTTSSSYFTCPAAVAIAVTAADPRFRCLAAAVAACNRSRHWRVLAECKLILGIEWFCYLLSMLLAGSVVTFGTRRNLRLLPRIRRRCSLLALLLAGSVVSVRSGRRSCLFAVVLVGGMVTVGIR